MFGILEFRVLVLGLGIKSYLFEISSLVFFKNFGVWEIKLGVWSLEFMS